MLARLLILIGDGHTCRCARDCRTGSGHPALVLPLILQHRMLRATRRDEWLLRRLPIRLPHCWLWRCHGRDDMFAAAAVQHAGQRIDERPMLPRIRCCGG